MHRTETIDYVIVLSGEIDMETDDSTIKLKAGDVLVSMTRPNLNAVAIVPPDLDGSIGSTGFHVLRANERALPQWLYYGVQGRDFVEAMSNLVQGALYPALFRLVRQGLLKASWGTSDNNRRAKFYELTSTGRKRLRQEADGWNRLAAAIASALDTQPEEV